MKETNSDELQNLKDLISNGFLFFSRNVNDRKFIKYKPYFEICFAFRGVCCPQSEFIALLPYVDNSAADLVAEVLKRFSDKAEQLKRNIPQV